MCISPIDQVHERDDREEADTTNVIQSTTDTHDAHCAPSPVNERLGDIDDQHSVGEVESAGTEDTVTESAVQDDTVDEDAMGEEVIKMLLNQIVETAAAEAVAAVEQEQEAIIDENSSQSIASDSTEFDGLVINEASADSSETVCNTKTIDGADEMCTNADATVSATTTTTTQETNDTESAIADAQPLAENANQLINTDVINANEDETATFPTSDEVSAHQTSRDDLLDLHNGDSNCSSSSSSSATSTSSSSSSSSSSSNHSLNSPKLTMQVDEPIHAINSRPAKRKLSTNSTDEFDMFAKQAKITDVGHMNRCDDDDDADDVDDRLCMGVSVSNDVTSGQTNGNGDDPFAVIASPLPSAIDKSAAMALASEERISSDHHMDTAADGHLTHSSPMAGPPLDLLESLQPKELSVGESPNEMTVASNTTKDDGCANTKYVNGFVDQLSATRMESTTVPQSYTAPTDDHHQQNTVDLKQHLKQQLLFGSFNEGVVNNYAQCLGLKPMVKFKCFKCGANDFTTMAELKNHHLTCLRNANNNLDKSMEIDPINNGKLHLKMQSSIDQLHNESQIFQSSLSSTEAQQRLILPPLAWKKHTESSGTVSTVDTKKSNV